MALCWAASLAVWFQGCFVTRSQGQPATRKTPSGLGQDKRGQQQDPNRHKTQVWAEAGLDPELALCSLLTCCHWCDTYQIPTWPVEHIRFLPSGSLSFKEMSRHRDSRGASCPSRPPSSLLGLGGPHDPPTGQASLGHLNGHPPYGQKRPGALAYRDFSVLTHRPSLVALVFLG